MADSVVIDPHKLFCQPLGIGIVVLKDKQHLVNSFHYTASYLQDAKDTQPWDQTPELSKPFRGLSMWFSIKLFGIKPFKDHLEEKLVLAQFVFHQLKSIGFKLYTQPELSMVLFKWEKRRRKRKFKCRNK